MNILRIFSSDLSLVYVPYLIRVFIEFMERAYIKDLMENGDFSLHSVRYMHVSYWTLHIYEYIDSGVQLYFLSISDCLQAFYIKNNI